MTDENVSSYNFRWPRRSAWPQRSSAAKPRRLSAAARKTLFKMPNDTETNANVSVPSSVIQTQPTSPAVSNATSTISSTTQTSTSTVTVSANTTAIMSSGTTTTSSKSVASNLATDFTMANHLADLSKTMQTLIDNHKLTHSNVETLMKTADQGKKRWKSQSSYLMPEPYTGAPLENATLFLNRYKSFCEFSDISKLDYVKLFPLLLSDSAKYWYDSLSATIKQDVEKLNTAFINKYGPTSVSFVQETMLLERNQKTGETLDQYYQDMVKRFSLLDTKEPERWKHFVRGLLPKLKAFVLQKECKNLEEAVAYAKTGEHILALENDSVQNVADLVAQLALHAKNTQTADSYSAPSVASVTTPTPSTPRPQNDDNQRRFSRPMNRQARPQIQRRDRRDRTTDGRPICHKCSRVGHIANFCRATPRSVTPTPMRPTKQCQWCNRRGHEANQCYQLQNRRSSGDRSTVYCQICDRSGHDAKSCTTWRDPQQQYQGGNPFYSQSLNP